MKHSAVWLAALVMATACSNERNSSMPPQNGSGNETPRAVPADRSDYGTYRKALASDSPGPQWTQVTNETKRPFPEAEIRSLGHLRDKGGPIDLILANLSCTHVSATDPVASLAEESYEYAKDFSNPENKVSEWMASPKGNRYFLQTYRMKIVQWYDEPPESTYRWVVDGFAPPPKGTDCPVRVHVEGTYEVQDGKSTERPIGEITPSFTTVLDSLRIEPLD